MQGGVTLQDDQTTASSQRALLRFASGHPEHLTLTGQAHLQQSAGVGVNRTVDAAEIGSSLDATAGAHLTIADLHASGSAKLVLLQPARQAGHVDRTELTAPTLVAHTVRNAKTAEIRDLEASGGAHLFQEDGSGSVRTSNSDDLFAAFAPLPASGQSAALQSLVQHGHVTIHETRPANAGQPGTSAQSSSQTDATADRAEFSAATDLLVLTGAQAMQRRPEPYAAASRKQQVHRLPPRREPMRHSSPATPFDSRTAPVLSCCRVAAPTHVSGAALVRSKHQPSRRTRKQIRCALLVERQTHPHPP